MTDLQKRLQEKAAAYEEYTIACRRKIHGIAEVSNEEVRTSAFVEEELKGMGLLTHRPAGGSGRPGGAGEPQQPGGPSRLHVGDAGQDLPCLRP